MFSPTLPKQLTYEDVQYDIHGSWIPNLTLNKTKIKDQTSVGPNNTTLLIGKCAPEYIGHELMKTRLQWQGVEDWVARVMTDESHTMVAFSNNPNRNIDYVRTSTKNNKKYYQFIEVKKTSGHSSIPPVIIKSTEQQRDALINNIWGEDDYIKISPSIYAIVSVDYDKRSKSYAYSLWAMPIRKKDDFDVMKTSTYKNLFPIHINKFMHDETKNSLRQVKKRLYGSPSARL